MKELVRILMCCRHPNEGPHNWLAYRIHDEALAQALKEYATGILVDIGCGEKPYAAITKRLVLHHIGIDCVRIQHDCMNVDIFSSAYRTAIQSSSVDTVLCTAVLEHLECPEDAILEMCRILKPGGYAIITAPLFWHLHGEPWDFYRYTSHGLKYLLMKGGLDILDIEPLGGFAITFGQELTYWLNRFRSGLVKYPVAGIQWGIQMIAYLLNKWDHSFQFTTAWLVIARRPR